MFQDRYIDVLKKEYKSREVMKGEIEENVFRGWVHVTKPESSPYTTSYEVY
ncbi:hypothetical protein SD78_1791 [Bacillus badius]|nr:hypothetical protein SD78_1791 [Bacillus badius]